MKQTQEFIWNINRHIDLNFDPEEEIYYFQDHRTDRVSQQDYRDKEEAMEDYQNKRIVWIG